MTVVSVSARAELLRRVGRAVLWLAVGVVLLRGLASIVGGAPSPAAPAVAPTLPAEQRFPDQEAQAFAVGFARAYLSFVPGHQEWVALALRPYLSPTLPEDAGLRVPDRGEAQSVHQATVARVQALDARRALITVAVTVANRTITTRYLTVPVAQDGGGALAVYDYPSLSSPPRRATMEAPVGEALPQGDADAVGDVLRRFFPVFFAGRGSGSELDYFLPPGHHLRSLTERYRFLGLRGVASVTNGGTRGHAVLATVEVQDAESGAQQVLRYRVTLERRDRWYVAGINAA